MRRQTSVLLLGVASQLWAAECGDVDSMMLNSFDEESVSSVSLLQHRVEPMRKNRAGDAEFSSTDASRDASLAMRELSDAIGKLAVVATASESAGSHGSGKGDFKIKEQAQQAQKEAFHAMKAMRGAFSELFSQHTDGTKKHTARIEHNHHHKGVSLTQMSASESNPPPLVFSWEGSPLTSDFEDATAPTSAAHSGSSSRNDNQMSNTTATLTAKVNESTIESPESPNRVGEQRLNSTDSLDASFMNDTVYIESSSLAVANASNTQNNTRRIVSESIASPQADAVAGTNGTGKVSNSTVLVANQTAVAENGDITKKGVVASVGNHTIGSNVSMQDVVEDAVNESTARSNRIADSNTTVEAIGDVAGDGRNTTLAVNRTAEMNSDEAPMPIFVFNGTKLAEDIDEAVNGDVATASGQSSLYRISSGVATDMDKVGMDMDHLIHNFGENMGDGGSTAGLAQVGHKFVNVASRAEREIAKKSSRAVSEMAANLVSLQAALAKMDAAELSL